MNFDLTNEEIVLARYALDVTKHQLERLSNDSTSKVVQKSVEEKINRINMLVTKLATTR